MIDVCYHLYGGDGFYCKMLGTSMASIFENTKEDITVHILRNDTLSDANMEKLKQLAKNYGQQVKFYHIDVEGQKRLDEYKAIYSSYERGVKLMEAGILVCTYKLVLPYLLPNNIKRAIILGTDTVVNRDIKDLWEVNLGTYPLAGIPEYDIHGLTSHFNLVVSGIVDPRDYFNADVLFLNIEYFRDNPDIICAGIKYICEHKEPNCFEQDILNYLFSKNYLRK